ncbi:MAG: hypothetical protein JWO00_649 [Candidatus Parcubacteria bacterium]|nr:hypothetical protein [Candidatus Parcubacteria bacterium]
MSTLHASAPHTLGQEEAQSRIKVFMDQAQLKLSGGPIQAPGVPPVSGTLEQKWEGNACEFTFTAQGQSISGTISVLADKVEVTAKLPMAAMLFKGKLETALTDGLAAILK